ncbi:MAG: chromosomal replication initiator protein DnaA [Armatimonadota bacterium]|nr:MAG: chromosomal replication initiator protein DnaA [Armatimonadota bacterium]
MTESRASAQEVWEQVLAALGKKAARASFESSIRQVQPRGVNGDCLELVVATEFARDWLEKRGRKAIEAALAEVTGRPMKLRLELGQMGLDLDGNTEPVRRRSGRTRQRPQGTEALASTPLNPKYTFANFVVGKSNQFAQAAALAVSRSPAKSYNPLFLYGGVGLGKTHLMQAIGHHVAREQPHLRVEYVSGDTFTFHVVSSIRDDRFAAFRKKYHEVELWLVDDIQFIAAKERTESEFFQVFNTLYETGRQVVISSDRPPKELQVMDDRLRSRFEWGLIADIKPPDLETRLAILAQKAQAEWVAVPEEVVHYIARMVKSNIRVLEGALIRVLAAASLTGAEITLSLAAEQLRDHSLDTHEKPLSIARVQELVAEHFNFSVPQLTARTRRRDVVHARQVAMYLCRELLSSSYPRIARAFGGKDHTTVIHACARIRDQMKDGAVQALVNELGARLRTEM